MDKWRTKPVGLCSMVCCRSSGTIDGVHAIPASVINTTYSNYLDVIPLLSLTYPIRDVSDFSLEDLG